MRTPILSTIFFLKMIIEMMSSVPFNLAELPKCIQYCELMMSQLEFVQSFVNDLLDLQMLDSGKFNLNMEPFDIQSVIKLMFSIF